jgi:hypothetical protein
VELLAGCGADLVFVGHTHEAMIRSVGDVLVVNLGSVSNPLAGDFRASWVLLDVGESGAELEHRRVAYDHARFIERVHRSRHPAAPFILSHLRGEQPGRRPHPDHVQLRPGERIRVTRGPLTA